MHPFASPYPYAWLIKEPLATWCLTLLAVAVSLRGAGVSPAICGESSAGQEGPVLLASAPQPSTLDHQPSLRDELILYVPALVVLVVVSSQTGFNHHLRYILPCVPALYIWLGRQSSHLAPRDEASSRGAKWLRHTVALCLAWFLASSLWHAPHQLSYFNELVGGPAGGRFHLVDSNVDWGQDLPALKRWYDAHPEARPLHLAYFGMMEPRVLGIEYSLPPKGPVTPGDFMRPDTDTLGPQPGWYAISVCPLMGHLFLLPDGKGGQEYMGEEYFTYFRRFRPVAKAGHSIFLYHVTPDEANRVRSELGLRLLPLESLIR